MIDPNSKLDTSLNLQKQHKTDDPLSNIPFVEEPSVKETINDDLSLSSDGTSSTYASPNTMIRQPHMNGLTADEEQSLIRYNHITYLLYIISFFTAGLTWIIPIFMNYAKRREAKTTWLASHFDWQIKTFWYSIFFGIIGLLMMLFSAGGIGVGLIAESQGGTIGSLIMFGLGALVFMAAYLWHLYRIIKGWIALSDKRPV